MAYGVRDGVVSRSRPVPAAAGARGGRCPRRPVPRRPVPAAAGARGGRRGVLAAPAVAVRGRRRPGSVPQIRREARIVQPPAVEPGGELAESRGVDAARVRRGGSVPQIRREARIVQPPAVEPGGELAESRGVDAARVRRGGPRDELGRGLGAGAVRGRERAGCAAAGGRVLQVFVAQTSAGSHRWRRARSITMSVQRGLSSMMIGMVVRPPPRRSRGEVGAPGVGPREARCCAMIKRSGARCCDSSMIARCNPCPCPKIMTWRTTS